MDTTPKRRQRGNCRALPPKPVFIMRTWQQGKASRSHLSHSHESRTPFPAACQPDQTQSSMSDAGFVQVQRRPGGVAIVSLNREPVNVLDLAMWQALAATLAELEAAGRIEQHASGLWPYAIDGGGLNLDIAKKGKRHYKRPRWRPVTWHTTRKGGRAA